MVIAAEPGPTGRGAAPAARAPVDEIVAGSDGTRLFVSRTAGAADGGLVTVLCDGILCDGYIWRYLRDDATRFGDVVHWNYRGHGRSGPPAVDENVHVRDHAADLVRVREHVGGARHLLIGHSMGCQVVLEGYRQRPEGVAGLVLLCGSYGRVTETFHGNDLLARVLPFAIESVVKRPGLARALWSRLPAKLAAEIVMRSGEVDAASIRPADLMPYLEHMTHVDLPMFLRMLRAAGEHSAADLLEAIDVPVLVVAGDRDSFTPSALAVEMAQRIPRATFVMLEGGTHVAPLEQPGALSRALAAFVRDAVRA